MRAGLLGTATVLFVGHALVFDFVCDDAFIAFRYAWNLVEHGQPVFNPGERVEGYTSFSWMVLMAAVIGLGLDPVFWSKLIGIVCGAGTLVVLASFASRVDGRSPWNAAAPLLLATWPAYACWSTGGLETQLFTLLVTVAWTRSLIDDDRTSGVWFGLSALTRPEGILFFALAIRRVRPVVGFLAVFLPYQIWRWAYYGWPFPNSYYVKAKGAALWGPGVDYVWSWVVDHHLYLVPLLALTQRGKPRFLVLAGLYTVAMSLHVMRVGGDFMALHRFLVPLMPLLAVVAARGVRDLSGRLPRWGVVLLLVVATAGLGARAVQVDRRALEVGSEAGIDSIGLLEVYSTYWSRIGLWLRDNIEADRVIGIDAAGAIPYYSRLETVDLLGLNDEWIAHHAPVDEPRPGHSRKAPVDYVLERKIDLLIHHPNIGRQPPAPYPAQRHWGAHGYVWRTAQIGESDPFWFGVWERVP